MPHTTVYPEDNKILYQSNDEDEKRGKAGQILQNNPNWMYIDGPTQPDGSTKHEL